MTSCVWLRSLSTTFKGSAMSLHQSVIHCLWPNNIPRYGYTTCCLSIHWLLHLYACFHLKLWIITIISGFGTGTKASHGSLSTTKVAKVHYTNFQDSGRALESPPTSAHFSLLMELGVNDCGRKKRGKINETEIFKGRGRNVQPTDTQTTIHWIARRIHQNIYLLFYLNANLTFINEIGSLQKRMLTSQPSVLQRYWYLEVGPLRGNQVKMRF